MNKSRKFYLMLGAGILLVGVLVGAVVVGVMGIDRFFFQTTHTGLAYKIQEKGQGTAPMAGQILLLEMMYRTKDHQVIYNSDGGLPLLVRYDDMVAKTGGSICHQAIGILKKGDKYIFKLPAKTLLGDHFDALAAKHQLQEHTPLYLHLHLKDITTEEGVKTIEAEYFQAMIKKRQEKTAQQLPKDIEAIDAYLNKHQLQAAATPSGLRYIMSAAGTGDNPQFGNIVSVNYIGRNLEGQVFDTNILEEAKKHNLYDAQRRYEPLQFTIGEGSMLPGFEEGIKLLNKHGKACLLVPSVLAYREAYLPPHIRPHASLVFDVELVDIQPGEDTKKKMPSPPKGKK